MALHTAAEYELMLKKITGLHCSVSAENVEDAEQERIRISYNGADVLYIKPPRTRQALEELLPAYLYSDDRQLERRTRIASELQENTSLFLSVAGQCSELEKQMIELHEKVFLEYNDPGVEEEGISVTERIERLRSQIGGAIFSLPEFSFVQLERITKRARTNK